jgi:Dyp-type peroxidase family
MTALTDDQLHNIQGFGLGGYRKDHQELLFIRFGDQAGARRLLASLQPRVASAWEVTTFNRLFSEIRRRTGREVIEATWIGAMVSAAGFQALGVPLTDLPAGEGATAFTAGMAARANNVGDTRAADAPASWLAPFRSAGGVHALIVVASDDPHDLDGTVAELGDLVSDCDAQVVHSERGATLPGGLRGHEHFGFRDGASQPGIDGYDPPPAAGEPAEVPLGEFVLGYPDATGGVPTVGPLWQDGSMVVFRRLVQDVAAFRTLAQAGVPGANPSVTAEQLAAKMIGRWPSGAPVELYPDADPGPNGVTNAFELAAAPANDDDGQKCPRWAHIRKANPRDETTPSPSTDAPALHRMLRRGIPFGPPLPASHTSNDDKHRGLHFFAVVADVARQFEFVQRQWLNDPNFPSGQPAPAGGYQPDPQHTPDGPDPVVGEHDAGVSCTLRQPSGDHPFPLADEVVTVTAGEYFFLPSLQALASLAAAPQ